MQVSQADIFIIPGLGNSGPDHWQSRWQAKLPMARRVEQDDWSRPNIAAWSARLLEEAEKATRPLVLVAHSFGGHAVAAAGAQLADKVRGAFIVAPPSERALAAMAGAAIVATLPKGPLPFKVLVIASRDDPYGEYEEVESLAKVWGAELSDAGNSGHINAESGHGPWPEGLLRFAGFMKTL
ncbi:MAG: RBBP9/YdeN family alpha/beta hydrolase [Beijerinckiaceae bacterium]